MNFTLVVYHVLKQKKYSYKEYKKTITLDLVGFNESNI